MNDLVTWLRVQLDEDEHAANDVARIGLETLMPSGLIDKTGAIIFFSPEVYSRVTDVLDPARVLAEVEAKRRLLDLHTITAKLVEQSPFDPDTGERRQPEYNVSCEVCGWASWDPTSACETVKLLALPYADRPGYVEAWRPS